MKAAIARARQIISTLSQLVRDERQALVARAFDRLAQIGERKSALSDEFAALSAKIENRDEARALAAELDELHSAAIENARQIQNLLAGVRRARETLKSIGDREKEAGAYQLDGERIRTAPNATLQARV